MSRRAFTAVIAGGILAAPLAIEAQPGRKVTQIGVLGATRAEDLPQSEGLRHGLRERGYVEGQNIVLEYRWAQGRFERLPGLAAELAELKPAVIVAFVTQASLAAKKATSTIPIVMVAVGDPVAAGLVASLTRPGGNVTGNSSNSVEVAGKSIEVLREVAPERRRVAILWNPANAVFQTQMRKESEAASRRLGLQARVVAASDAGTIDKAFQAVTRERTEALVILADPVFIAERARVAALAAKGRLPTVGGLREYADAGGLVAYGPNFYELYRGAAAYVDRILKGAKPGDLPVEQPTKFELVINLKTAKAIGLTVPPSLLQRADQLIE
ncbi:MAG TPA: ABC transporter substrate-binding protein [Methylomirabilota bacterium]|nr:ABC transporter substrate-binding protein [Methylomirabilota bacterium]